ncbi:MAG: hypothetical protein OXF06_03110 [Bacteroidetes bacterium]|nr:hypothetical protein [Bacteroidota bacterium]
MIVVRPDAVAVKAVDASGAVATDASVVALATLEGGPEFTALMARTR